MMYDIYLALSELKLVYKYHEKRVTFATERLYQQFIELSPLLPLPPNATAWSFSLITLFIRLAGYILPNNTTLSTLSSQTSDLQILREKSVVVHTSLCEEKQRVLSILHSVSLRNTGINQMYSQAELNIRSHTDTKHNLDRHDLS